AFGFSSTGYLSSDGLAKHLITDELIQAPVEREQIDSGPGESLDCVVQGMFLLRRGGVPIVAAIRPPRGYTSDLPVLEVLAATRETARESLSALLEEAQKGSVYKGRTLSLEHSQSWREGPSIRFHEVRPTRREDIVLPDELISVVERNVLGM